MIKDKIKETENTAVYSFDGSISMRLCGVFANSVKFIERNQLCEVELWK